MKHALELLKATALGGFLFLVPIAAAGLVLAKAFQFMKRLAEPFSGWLEAHSGGILLGDLLAAAALLLVCLAAGLVARSPYGKRLGEWLESVLVSIVPGYGFVKGFTDSMSESDTAARAFKPVVARFDDNAQLAFEVERDAGGNVVVYLPGAPNPWSGSVVFMSAERVAPLKMSMPEATKHLRQLGRGVAALGAAR